jgi:hypothetical protein
MSNRQQASVETAETLLRSDAVTAVLVGTGGPFPSERAQSCTALFVNGQFLLFDAGDGAARRMEALNLPVGQLGKIAQMTQSRVCASQLDLCGVSVYNANRPQGQARGIGCPTGSSRLSALMDVLSWRQRLWSGQSLTQNTRQTGTTFGVTPRARDVSNA